MSVLFKYCAEGLHVSCVRFGPLPTTAGGSRLECCCPCHIGSGHDSLWKPSDADRMATYFAFEHGSDPRIEQIVEGVVGESPITTVKHALAPCDDCGGVSEHQEDCRWNGEQGEQAQEQR